MGWMVLAAQNAQFTGNKNVVEAGIEPARMSDYLIRLHYNPTPAVSNRLYTARYKLGPYGASVYERLEFLLCRLRMVWELKHLELLNRACRWCY
jgi:hypothetical protein